MARAPPGGTLQPAAAASDARSLGPDRPGRFRGPNGTKVRHLTELGYNPFQIGHISLHSLSGRSVNSSIETLPCPTDAREPGPGPEPNNVAWKPSSVAASVPGAARPIVRPSAPPSRHGGSWVPQTSRPNPSRSRSWRRPAPPAAALANDQAVVMPAIAAAPRVNPWVGPRSPHATKTRSHL